MKILVVDDDDLMLDLIEGSLQAEGHDVTRAKNGKAALDKIHHKDFRLVITDWNMPEMNGIELCRAIREKSSSQYIYIIMVTGFQESEKAIEGISAGADDFLKKPFNPKELVVRVRAAERVLALETRDLVIFALAKLADSRDPETGQHLERVQCYSEVIAREIERRGTHPEVDANYVQLIYKTSPLHDIGKVAIPDSVLLKPGKLTDEEFDLMKTHATHGAQTLEALIKVHPEAQYLAMARDIAASHHEKYNGKGYPQGLAGEDIPLCGRIVALVDVYDALTSSRVYKGPFTHDKSRDIIVEGKGTHFDPEMVDAFLAIENEIIAIHKELGDEAARTTL